jgi:hypothetical protein
MGGDSMGGGPDKKNFKRETRQEDLIIDKFLTQFSFNATMIKSPNFFVACKINLACASVSLLMISNGGWEKESMK